MLALIIIAIIGGDVVIIVTKSNFETFLVINIDRIFCTDIGIKKASLRRKMFKISLLKNSNFLKKKWYFFFLLLKKEKFFYKI